MFFLYETSRNLRNIVYVFSLRNIVVDETLYVFFLYETL